MKKLFLFAGLFISAQITYSQVGIGTTTPDPSSSLDVSATDKGILVPRVSLSDVSDTVIDGVNTAATGLLIYNTNAATTGGSGVGYYYFNGGTWERLITSATNTDDIDWYEEGTTTSPNAITDDMYTQGNVAIGKTTADWPLDIEEDQGGRGISVLMSGSNNVTTYGLLSEVTNSADATMVGLFGRVLGSGNGEHRGVHSLLNGGGTGIHYGVFSQIQGTGNGAQYGSGNYITNSGNGAHYGSYSSLTGNGSGTHTGYYASMTGDGSGETRGFVASIGGNATGIQRGTFVHIANSEDGEHYGGVNRISGSGNGFHYGVYNLIESTGTGTHYAVRSDMTGVASGSQVGTRNVISNTADGDHWGVYNTLSGSGTGYHTGTRNTFNAGDGNLTGTWNAFSGTLGNGNQLGAYTIYTSGGNGILAGTYVDIEPTVVGTGTQYGMYIENGSPGGGEHYGFRTHLGGAGTGNQFGVRNLISNTEDGSHWGAHNTFSGTGSGLHTGMFSSFSEGTGNLTGAWTEFSGNIGDGNQIGAYNNYVAGGNGILAGVYTEIQGTVTGTGAQYGTYFTNSSTGDGDHYGSYNVLGGSGIGAQYGSYNSITNTNDNLHFGSYTSVTGTFTTSSTTPQWGQYITMNTPRTGIIYGSEIDITSVAGTSYGYQASITSTGVAGGDDYGVASIITGTGNNTKYGLYSFIDGASGGTHYGVYSDVSKVGSYSGYFVGDVLGTARLDLNNTTLDATPTAGSGILELGGALRLDANEIITNTGTTLFLQHDNGGDLRVDNTTLFVDGTNNRVGIGTITPGFALDATSRIRVGNAVNTAGIWYSDGTNDRQFAGVHTHSATGTAQKWGVWNNSSWRFIVQGNGNVGIGTVNPAYQLQLSTNSGAKPTSALWTVASDERLKSNVAPYLDGLELIQKINPVWFTYNGKAGMPNEKGVGTLAQDFQKIAPYMVKNWEYKTDENAVGENYLAIDYGPLTFTIVNAIKEQQAIIEEQQSEIDELKSLVKQLLDIKE